MENWNPEFCKNGDFRNFGRMGSGKKFLTLMYDSIAFCALITNTQKLCRNLYSFSRYEVSSSGYIYICMVAHWSNETRRPITLRSYSSL